MRTLSRRAFTRTIVTAAIIPPVAAAATPAQQAPQAAGTPVAGYLPTAEEQRLMEKFLADHEVRMSPLRERPLANDLPPLFCARPPASRRSRP